MKAAGLTICIGLAIAVAGCAIVPPKDLTPEYATVKELKEETVESASYVSPVYTGTGTQNAGMNAAVRVATFDRQKSSSKGYRAILITRDGKEITIPPKTVTVMGDVGAKRFPVGSCHMVSLSKENPDYFVTEPVACK